MATKRRQNNHDVVFLLKEWTSFYNTIPLTSKRVAGTMYDYNHIKTKEQLAIFFSSLPNDVERKFEVSLAELVNNINMNDFENTLREILSTDVDKKNKYAAFYTLAILHRYRKDFPQMEQHIKQYQDDFCEVATYSHLMLLYRLSSLTLTYDDIETAYENSLNMSKHAGVVHLFADICATFYERAPVSNEDRCKTQYIQKAIEAVNGAIKLERNYAKFHSTKSRLLFLAEQIEEALAEIDEAIAKELPKNLNYTVNMYAYHNHKMNLVVERGKHEIVEQTEKEQINMKKEIDRINANLIKNIEFIGLFAGIIALVLGSLQIAANQPLLDAIKLIIVLFGSLLSAFAGFGIVLHGFDKKYLVSNGIVMSLGLGIIGVVLLFL